MCTGDAEASSLMRWLNFYAANAQEDCASIVLRLLKLAFPATVEELKALSGWKAVIAALEGFYETNLAVDVEKLAGGLNNMLTTLLQLVLGAVVQSETKETFIKDILTMEDAVQSDLMGIIKRVMVQGVLVLNVEVADETSRTERDAPAIGSPLYLSRNAVVERVQRENEVLKDENIHLAQKMEQATKKFHELERENVKLVDMMQGLKQQMDAEAVKRQRALHSQYNKRISSLQRELESTKNELQDKEALASRVPVLTDEVDLLRPIAEKMKKTEATVAKYKAKVDALSGAKDMLQRLESTNAELVKRNLVLEGDVAKAATWQRKLKEAKEAKTALEMQVIELESTLAHEREEVRRTRAEIEAIQGVLHESRALNTQLQISDLQLADVAASSNSCPTITSGISELNPELMQRLTRLEFENVALKKQLDSATEARVDRLVDELDDLTRLKQSFEKKYLDTQRTLQSTQSELKQTKEQYASLVTERDCLAAELSDRTDRNYQLELGILRRDQQVSDLRDASEALTRQNEQLVAQYESLARRQQDAEARQVECTGMQVEDARADRMRFEEQKAQELDQVCRHFEARMTVLLSTKSAEIENLTSRLQESKLKYGEDLKQLEEARALFTNKLEQYQEQYSLSNADWSAKEAQLNCRIVELDRQCKQQEKSLKSTIRSQLESNTRLVERNKAMKVDALDKRETIARLQNTISHLESRVALLEKERSHLSSQDERNTNAVNEISSYSCQLSTQVNLLSAELESVLKENKDLYVKQNTSRELLLVNAKLIQEQRQLHVKNASLADRILELEESVTHWRLLVERRQTEEEQSKALGNKLPAPELPTEGVRKRKHVAEDSSFLEPARAAESSSEARPKRRFVRYKSIPEEPSECKQQ
ncbi:HOOK domain-containing protein [Phytophthora infestans]|uniref:HOOK domain-containing protein n=1 Tax=Phytophthora infestans TaxID=4787 RepID=A0A833SII3_PHYIN|nr:HOOK domain-containing protein [Phytophthora infestans]